MRMTQKFYAKINFTSCTYVCEKLLFLFLISYFVFCFSQCDCDVMWGDVSCRLFCLYLCFYFIHFSFAHHTPNERNKIKWSISILNTTELCCDMIGACYMRYVIVSFAILCNSVRMRYELNLYWSYWRERWWWWCGLWCTCIRPI